jgi:asparagine synthase (glutamine-hydrolysing)
LASQFQAMPGDTPFEKALEFERTVRLPAYHLRRVDHLSMAHAVEVRVPFCQRRILDFARMTPSDLLVDANAVKKVLYAVAHSYLPASVLRRPKQPFTLPVGAMFRKSDALSAFAREVLSAGIVRSIGIFNSDTVDQLFERERTCSTGKAAEALWALMIFHLWADLSVSSAS